RADERPQSIFAWRLMFTESTPSSGKPALIRDAEADANPGFKKATKPNRSGNETVIQATNEVKIARGRKSIGKLAWAALLLFVIGAGFWGGRELFQPPEPSTSPECSKEKSLRSLGGEQSTAISFTNNSGEPITLFWLDYNGDRVPYGTLAQGATLR